MTRFQTIRQVTAVGLALAALLAAPCTARADDTRDRNGAVAFETVAAQIRNPCTGMPGPASLLGVLESGEMCFEASVLSDDVSFFLSRGLSADQTVSMVTSAFAAMLSPHEFRTGNRPRLGQETAPVEIVIFSDFECPYCARAAKTMHRIAEKYAQDVSVVFKQMPLSGIHPYAAAAAVVSVFAHEKGRFWEIHDALFGNRSAISADFLTRQLENLGATPKDVFDPVKGQPYGVVIVEDTDDAKKAGVGGTPAVFIDGVYVQGGADYERVSTRIEALRYAQKANLKRARAMQKLRSPDGATERRPKKDEKTGLASGAPGI